MPASEYQRLTFRDRFRSVFTESFQTWFEELARKLHPIGDFVRVRRTSGDGALDGFVISSQLVYQIYAPVQTTDSATASKISADFATALNTLAGQLKCWVFVHNHPQGALGKLSIAAINKLRNDHPGIEIAVFDIDSLWEKLSALPDDSLNTLFGGPARRVNEGIFTEDTTFLQTQLSVGFTKTHDALSKLPSDLETTVRNAVKSAMAEGSQEAEQSKSSNQRWFDRAREELIHGSITVAENEYRALVTELEAMGARADRNLLFRSYTNLGSSLWQQFRRDEAVGWFDKAFATQPNEQKAQTNKAAAHIHRKEFNEALTILEELRKADPDCFEAHYLISCVHLELGEADQAIAVLESRQFDCDDYFAALAQAYLRCGNYPKATEAAKTALTKNHKSTEAMVMLANCLGFPLVQRRMHRETTAFSLTESERQQILEAIHNGEIAANALRKQARSYQLGEMLTNLSAFYELAGDDEKAAEKAKQASEFTPHSVTTLTNLWAAQMRLGKFSHAYDTAGRLIEIGEALSGKLRQLESLLFDSKHDRLLEEAVSSEELTQRLLADPHYWELRAHAEYELHQIETALATIADGLAKFPADARLLCLRALLRENLGQLDAAREDLRQAEESPEGGGPRVVLQSAIFHLHRGEWSGAAQRFARLGAESIHSPFLDKYLICLHNLGQFTQCFALATRALEAREAFDPTLHELAARCAYNANALPAARRHFETLVQHNTAKVIDHQKLLAQVYLRLDDPDKALGVLKKAHARAPKDVDVLILMSFVSSLKKQHQEALGFAFAAMNSAGKNPRAHMVLVKAALDCPPEVRIEGKYRKAIQRSLAFLNKHPSGLIKAIPFEKDLKSIIAMVRARAEHASQIVDLIQTKNLPMCILAQQLGLPPFQAWLGIIGHANLHVRLAYGTQEEQSRELLTANGARSVCVDVFALLTLRLLKCLDLLPRLFSTILVHTAVLEAIVQSIREMETQKTGFAITYHEGRILRSEIGPEQTREQLLFLKDVRDFLKSHAVELVGLDASLVSSDEMKKARDCLGAMYYEPILVAKSCLAAYYADDAPMRSLALDSHGVAGFSTQAVLRAARERKVISNVQYEDAIITLLRHNYYFISESAETLERLLCTEGYEPSELSKMMLGRVADSKVDQSTAVRIISDFSLYIWRADLSKARVDRTVWLGICVDSVLRANQPERLLVEFVSNLGVRSLTQPPVFGGITDWVLRCGKLSRMQRQIFYIALQQTALQMVSLAGQEYSWWPALQEQWRHMTRVNLALERNGWV